MTSVSFDFDAPSSGARTANEKWDKYLTGRDPHVGGGHGFPLPPPSSRPCAGGWTTVFGYSGAPDELVEVIIARLREDHGWSVAPEWLVWLPGLVTGLNVTCRAVGGDGDDVLTAVPVYPPFLTAPRHARRNLIPVPLALDGGRWRFDLDRLRAAVTPRSRLLLLCNPHNPVGRVFSRAELFEVAAFAERHDLVIGSDEIHCGLVLDAGKRHIPIASLSPAIAARTITLMAPSKTYNLPGLGCAFAVISNEALRRRFTRAMAGIVPHVNVLGFTAALAAYRDGGPWLAALLDYLRGNRELVLQAINALPGLSAAPVEATYLAWIDVRGSGLPHPGKFFEDAGVGLSEGRDFAGEGFLRLNFGCPRSLLRTALERMDNALRSARGNL